MSLMTECIDLKERFGQEYRVQYEESHRALHGPRSRAQDPWLRIIPCMAGGHIFPWGGSVLAAYRPHGPTINKVATLPGARVWTDGSDGVTVLFDVAIFDRVAELMHPRRRRHLTPEQREAAARRLAEYRARTTVERP